MASFLEKLKKGMKIEGKEEPEIEMEESEEMETEEGEEPKKAEKTKSKKAKEIEMEVRPLEKEGKRFSSIKISDEDKKEKREIKIENKKEATQEEVQETTPQNSKKRETNWLEPEGQLAIDVYQTENELVVVSAIAGIKAADIDILLEKDILSIQGERRKPAQENGDYFFQECFWGRFARQIILPVEVDPNWVDAKLKDGVLIIRMPKIMRDKKRKISIKE